MRDLPSPTAAPPVVLIDDEQEVGIVMRGLLGRTQIPNQLLVYHDAGSAMKFLAQADAEADRQPGRVPCLVFVDINMPVVDGVAVIRWVRDQARLSSTKLVVLSASNSEADRERTAIAGADHYLVKYPSSSLLAALVRWSVTGGEIPTE